MTIVAGQPQNLEVVLRKKPTTSHVSLGRNEIDIKGTIHFGTNNAELRPDGEQLLDEVADVHGQASRDPARARRGAHRQPRQPRQEPAAVQGARSSGGGLPRQAGIDPSRLESEGYGATQPLVPNMTPAQRREEPARHLQDPRAGGTSVKRALLMAIVAVAAMSSAIGGGVGCHEGNGLGAADLEPALDLLPAPPPPPDLSPPPNCGKIVFCALACLGGGIGVGGGGGDMSGANPVGCVLGCGQNAPTAEVTAALSLIACAAQNCLADGGSSGQLGMLQCLQTSCAAQVKGCKGLGFGG